MKYSATYTADQTDATGESESSNQGEQGLPVWAWVAIGGGILVIVAGIIITIVALSRRNRSNRPPTPPVAGYPAQPYPSYPN